MSVLIVATLTLAAAWIANVVTYPTGEYEIANRSYLTAILAAATFIVAVAWIAVLLNKVL